MGPTFVLVGDVEVQAGEKTCLGWEFWGLHRLVKDVPAVVIESMISLLGLVGH